jgi:hypothetical protein
MSVLHEHLLDEPAFDEAYCGWGLEDTDLCYRLYRKGLRVRFDLRAINYHQVHPLGGSGLRSGAEQRARECERNFRHFCRKFKTLESYMFWRCHGDLSRLPVQELAERANRDASIHDELLWAYRELLSLREATNLPWFANSLMSGQQLVQAA